MHPVYSICCGLDVHKRTVTACLLRIGRRGQVTRETQTFETTTSQLLALADWLTANGCEHVAMESTGVYWKPVYNILEGVCQEVMLVNAQHIKNVPGRKTDVKDAEWIAELLSCGLLRGSFIPPREIRELRDLTRYRKTLIEQRADQCNRIQKLLEDCNVKLASVATDILGVSGWAMLNAIAEGESDPQKLAELARGRMRKKIPQLVQALNGVLRDHQRWLLRQQLNHVRHLEQQIGELTQRIEQVSAPFFPQLEKLSQIPGVSRQLAQTIVAEIGVDMRQFPSAAHLASWASICPGNRQSGGKRQSGRTRRGSRWLKAALTEAAWAASHTRNTYLAARYPNLARRRGRKRAVLGVGHTILKIVYHHLANPDAEYTDLGLDYHAPPSKEQLAAKLLRQLDKLGFKVAIETAA
ncbi:MAG: IS110 family transposase [Planctomycetes bacterium]|nr:IS110 family transposase [Planctomycetota bacterium]